MNLATFCHTTPFLSSKVSLQSFLADLALLGYLRVFRPPNVRTLVGGLL
jgi:hypothetical protein